MMIPRAEERGARNPVLLAEHRLHKDQEDSRHNNGPKVRYIPRPKSTSLPSIGNASFGSHLYLTTADRW